MKDILGGVPSEAVFELVGVLVGLFGIMSAVYALTAKWWV